MGPRQKACAGPLAEAGLGLVCAIAGRLAWAWTLNLAGLDGRRGRGKLSRPKKGRKKRSKRDTGGSKKRVGGQKKCCCWAPAHAGVGKEGVGVKKNEGVRNTGWGSENVGPGDSQMQRVASRILFCVRRGGMRRASSI